MYGIKDMAGMEFDKLLQQAHLGELDVVYSRILNDQLDMSKELLSVFLAPADDTLRPRLHGTVFTTKHKLLFAYAPFVYMKTVKMQALLFSF